MKKLSELVPGIPCEEDEVVALVDSGSTINAAWIREHFPEYAHLIIDSDASLRGEAATTAGGHQLKNEGRCRIEATVDGQAFPIPFQNMKVDVPILSVRKYVKAGFSFHFTEECGYMACTKTGRRFDLIESDGSFRVKMKVQKPVDPEPPSSGFVRPGRP